VDGEAAAGAARDGGPRQDADQSILKPWGIFRSLYPRSDLPDIVLRLFATPASEAEAERTIKIMRAVIGRFGGQMSMRVLPGLLVARVGIAMDCLQRRRNRTRIRQSCIDGAAHAERSLMAMERAPLPRLVLPARGPDPVIHGG
jgi:hypothetical protein